jgi:cysteine desulfurase
VSPRTQKDAIYLDANAGVLVHPKVGEALRAILQDDIFGANPSSVHVHGRKAKHLVLEARDRVARSLGALSTPDSLVFTSSGTEANQLVVRSVFEPILESQQRAHWITTPVEHDCNLQMVDWLTERGVEVSFLPVDSDGTPQVSALPSLLRADTALVSVIWVGNETGVVSPIEEFAQACSKASIPLHVDGAQAWGKLPVELDRLSKFGLTYAAFAPHKIGALSGTGVLWTKKGARLISQIRGQQQSNRRGGTENLLGIYAAGVAASQIDAAQLSREQAELAELRDRLQTQIQSRIPGTLVNGETGTRVGGTLSLCFEGIERDGLVQALDLEGYSVSSGSACSSGSTEPSHVLRAIGRSDGLASAGLRISIPSGTNWENLEGFVETLKSAVQRIRGHREVSAGSQNSKSPMQELPRRSD